jgi:DNA-binding XRE family transcriptional regulator
VEQPALQPIERVYCDCAGIAIGHHDCAWPCAISGKEGVLSRGLRMVSARMLNDQCPVGNSQPGTIAADRCWHQLSDARTHLYQPTIQGWTLWFQLPSRRCQRGQHVFGECWLVPLDRPPLRYGKAYYMYAYPDLDVKAYFMIAAQILSDYPRKVITPRQVRAARQILSWTQSDLAKAAGLSIISIKDFERGAVDPRASTLDKIELAFDTAGIVFLSAGDVRPGGEGVRLK